MKFTLETLDVYLAAEEFSNAIWDIVAEWKFFEKDTVGKQFVRSADSISANIAEGYGRYYFSESIMFYYYSRGSILETKSWLKKSVRRKLINQKQFDFLIQELESIHFKLNSFIKYVTKTKKNLKK